MKRRILSSTCLAILTLAPCCWGQDDLADLGEAEEAYDLPATDSWFSNSLPVLVDWEGDIELGINGSEGNAQSFSMRAGGSLKRETERSIWEADFAYGKTNANSVETQHFGTFNLRYERLFESPWTQFIRFSGMYDEFQAYDLRLFTNVGLGYRLLQTDTTTFKARAGAGLSREFGGPNDDLVPEANFGLDFEHQLTKRQQLTATIDYFPDVRDFGDYRLMTDLGWQLLLDEESNLSLKLSLIDWYDSTPEGRESNDINYAILLLWKL
jgi:putative salt-induced outer membrane protein YdiY